MHNTTSAPIFRHHYHYHDCFVPLWVFCIRFASLLLLLLLVVTSTSPSTAHEYRNVYGRELQTCSQGGMALTGYTRNGRCVAHDGDRGSHHICINLNSTKTTTAIDNDDGGKSMPNFCQVTGQPDWCSSTQMQCHEDPSQQNCPIHNWCVCQWAFARYIEKAGGCHQIQDIICNAINMEALTSYQKHKKQFSNALNCLIERCQIPTATTTTTTTSTSTPTPQGGGRSGHTELRFVLSIY